MLGIDAITLAKTVAKYDLGHSVMGPAYAGFNKGAEEFLSTVSGTPAVTGFTCHNYPLGGSSACNFAAYLDPTPLRKMGNSVAGIAAAKAASGNSDILLVLEETGGSYGGGCENITDRFISGEWRVKRGGFGRRAKGQATRYRAARLSSVR